MKILLYQIYGDIRDYHLELSYSILSAHRFLKEEPDDISIVLISETSNHRPDLPCESLIVSSETMREWQMGGAYKHAIQAYSLLFAINHFQSPVVLIDSDTIFHAHPRHLFERISPGKTLTHKNEGTLITSPEWPEWQRLIDQFEGRLAKSPIGPDSVMYNAGVLGIHPQDAALMNEVVSLTHTIRDASNVFTAVQLAASLVFASRTNISTCDDIVEHYWDGPRHYYHYQMNKIFPDFADLEKHDLSDLKIPPLRKVLKGKIRHRLAARIRSLSKGRDHRYNYACLSYLSALYSWKEDQDLANVWAGNALNTLKWGLQDWNYAVSAKDFEYFTPPYIDQQTWMHSGLKKKWKDYWKNAVESSASKSVE